MKAPTITASQAIDILEETFGEGSYQIEHIRLELQKLEAKTILKNFTKFYGNGWWDFAKYVMKISKDFDDRAEALKWMINHGHINQEFSKYSYCDSKGEPRTQCILSASGVFEGVPTLIEAQYSRSGMSSSKCKVVPRTTYSVVCDL